jgi:RimJ/RimL family protein N-acetyltransferase
MSPQCEVLFDLTPRVLEGGIVRLEPLTLAHAPDLLEYALDPDLWAFTTNHVETADDLRRYIETALREQEQRVSLPYAHVLRSTGRAVGTTRFAAIAPKHRRVEIGWTWIGRAHQRTAVNTEAKFLMMCHAFETWGCLRVELKANALNARSRQAMLRIGCVEEGTLRQHAITDRGVVRDTVYYSVIAREWPLVKSRLEGLMRG